MVVTEHLFQVTVSLMQVAAEVNLVTVLVDQVEVVTVNHNTRKTHLHKTVLLTEVAAAEVFVIGMVVQVQVVLVELLWHIQVLHQKVQVDHNLL